MQRTAATKLDVVPAPTPEPIAGDFFNKHIVTVGQFRRSDLDVLFAAASSLRTRLRQRDLGVAELAKGSVMALLFFESSTRTDLSFQAAMRRLGGEVVGVSNGIQFSSAYKGEDLHDTIRAAGCYADVITLRHPEAGASLLASQYLDRLDSALDRRPVLINAGDGIGEHPTQALLDLYTILDFKKTLDGISISMVGDLKHGRTVHSLARLVCAYEPVGASLNLLSPPELRMSPEIVEVCRSSGLEVNETSRLSEALGDLRESGVIYWTRVQEERFSSAAEYESVKDDFVMKPLLLKSCSPDTLLMHPLPRKHEMGSRSDHDELDADPRSVYFQQMENGMFVRMALLAKVLRGAHV